MCKILIEEKLKSINSIKSNVNIMEVCGTHTSAISKYGIRNLLNENINLTSGPGCPICVTPSIYIDYVYFLSLQKDIIIVTYGDMLRVPGSKPCYSLEKAKALGAKIYVVYSSIEAIRIARENKYSKVVFLGIGFETTICNTAIVLIQAEKLKLSNFFVFSMHKRMEPVIKELLKDKNLKINAFLCPGHVAAIIGEIGFKFIEEENSMGVIAGFQFEEIIDALYKVCENIRNNRNVISNRYKGVVRYEGNLKATHLIECFFNYKDDVWRGLGKINNSGFVLKDNYKKFDITEIYPLKYVEEDNTNQCMCGQVIKGIIKPMECKNFKVLCTPINPIGPCMVSREGTCYSSYIYNAK